MNKTYNRPSYIDPSTITDGGRYYHAAEVDETIAALRQRIAELEGERDALRQLAAFAQHPPNCPSPFARNCPCGYTAARSSVAAALDSR